MYFFIEISYVGYEAMKKEEIFSTITSSAHMFLNQRFIFWSSLCLPAFKIFDTDYIPESLKKSNIKYSVIKFILIKRLIPFKKVR